MVIPKRLREAIGVGEGGEVDIEFVDGVLMLVAPATTTRIEQRDGRPTIVTDEGLPPLRDDVVKAVRNDVRR